jgi:signal peptidase I
MLSRKIWNWLAATALAAFIVTKIFFVTNYKIPQNGMYPGLPAGSRLYVWKRAYSDASHVKRGDVVVFRRQEDGKEYIYIWRVVGLPGEKVETSGESVTINGAATVRQRLREADGMTIYRETIAGASYEIALDPQVAQRPPDKTVEVPPGHFFVMGDNRLHALDSRLFGPISFSSIIGKKL